MSLVVIMTFGMSKELRNELQQAGWQEGRSVDVSCYESFEFELFPAARQLLSEFSGLKFGKCGSGKECATSDVCIDPSVGEHLTAEMQTLQRVTGQRHFVLGEFHRRHGYLLVDESGRIFIMNGEVLLLADSFISALEKLIHGYLPEESAK